MSRTMQKTKTTPTKAVETDVEVESSKSTSVLSKANVMEPPKKKKYADDQEIPCRSVTAGMLIMHGEKSDRVYTWQGMNDVQYVEYRDLVYAYRKKSAQIFKPRFVILDEDFVSQYKDISDCYISLYSFSDIQEILKKSPSEIRNIIENLPEGIRDSIKVTVVTMIDNGEFDSAQRIKVLDDIFGTEMLRKLIQ